MGEFTSELIHVVVGRLRFLTMEHFSTDCQCPHDLAAGSPKSEGCNRERAEHGSHNLL